MLLNYSSLDKNIHKIISSEADYNILDSCAQCLLSLPPDFIAQKYEIKEKIQRTLDNLTGHQVIYYLTLHFEVFQIQYFWCNTKSYTYMNYIYNIERLKKILPISLKNVKTSTILGNYNIYKRKMHRYKEKVEYSSFY